MQNSKSSTRSRKQEDIKIDEKMILSVNEAAKLLNISRTLLDKLRWSGLGPKYIKIETTSGKGKNTRVLYSKQALMEWIESKQIETA